MSEANARAIAGSILADAGHTLSKEGQDAIVASLAASIRYDANVKAFLADNAGNPLVTVNAAGDVVDVTFPSFVADFVKANPSYLDAKTKAETKTPPADENLTQKMLRLKAEGGSARAKAISASVDGNPWLSDQWNLTRQMMISRADPARAQRLRALAKGGKA